MTLHEKKQYDQLRALARYQKIGVGPEALLFKKMLERRKAVSWYFYKVTYNSYAYDCKNYVSQVTPGLVVRTKNYNKCTYTEGGVKCLMRVLPSTKHCKKHILNVSIFLFLQPISTYVLKVNCDDVLLWLKDRAQVLFQACGIQKQDHTCKEPIVPIPIPNATCTFHFSLPNDVLPLKKVIFKIF